MVWCKHGFSDEDQILMKNLYIFKGLEQRFLLLFYSVIFVHKLDIIRKEYIEYIGFIFTQLQYYQILLKSVNI